VLNLFASAQKANICRGTLIARFVRAACVDDGGCFNVAPCHARCFKFALLAKSIAAPRSRTLHMHTLSSGSTQFIPPKLCLGEEALRKPPIRLKIIQMSSTSACRRNVAKRVYILLREKQSE